MIETSKEMNVQNNRCTDYPLFVIMVDTEDWCNEAIADKCKRIEDTDVSLLCEKCQKLWEQDEELPDSCDDCDPDAFNWYCIKQEFDLNAGVFFTAKACQEHIDANKYHYDNPVVYGIGCWRNPEMIEVIKFMREISKDKKEKK